MQEISAVMPESLMLTKTGEAFKVTEERRQENGQGNAISIMFFCVSPSFYL